ncbi:MAG: hydrogenase maturation nickel metallochaperone HypA [Candidatus Sumerlaeia bacterium]|nr:hydrogenase maturation nickel metallochaperone HypA [Candidatus Sumerlaeia bacterium]
MHEMAIAESIAEQVEAAIAAAGHPRVLEIRVRAGALRAIVPEALTFCFAAVAQGSPLEGASLQVAVVPVTILCPACGVRAELEDGAPLICGRCGGPGDLIAGRELLLESIEVEE